MPEQVYSRVREIGPRLRHGREVPGEPTYRVELSESGLTIRVIVLDEGRPAELAQVSIHAWDAIDDAVGELLAEAADRAWQENTAYRLLEGNDE